MQNLVCFLVLALIAVSSPLSIAMAAVSDNTPIEVLQAKASIHYHAKEYQQCLNMLDKVLLQDRQNIEALELAALTHRKMKNDAAASKLYETLIKIAPKERRSPYYFDLATIQYSQKKTKEAHASFNKAVWGNFNQGTSHFYMGMIDFTDKKWHAAKNNLAASLTYNDGKAFEPITRYYLANAYAQVGQTQTAIQNYHAADLAIENQKRRNSGSTDTLTTDMRKNILKELKNFDRGDLYVSLSMMSQWDNNVQTNPVTATDPLTKSSKKSAKAVMNVTAGGSTSPTRKIQTTGSYSLYTNYNAHYLARDFNFITHSGNVITMYKPYSRFTAGVKVAGTFSMKNNLLASDERSKLKYRKYSTQVDVGPVAKFEVTPRLNVSAETFYRPKWFYLDPASGDARRTGGGLFSRLSGEFLSPFTWFAPLAYASFEWDHPRGKTYRVYTWGGGISNALSVTDKLTVTPGLDFSSADYYAILDSKRDDFFMSYKVGATYLINQKWMALADFMYINNTSSQTSSFGYNRIVTSLGASYNF